MQPVPNPMPEYVALVTVYYGLSTSTIGKALAAVIVTTVLLHTLDFARKTIAKQLEAELGWNQDLSPESEREKFFVFEQNSEESSRSGEKAL